MYHQYQRKSWPTIRKLEFCTKPIFDLLPLLVSGTCSTFYNAFEHRLTFPVWQNDGTMVSLGVQTDKLQTVGSSWRGWIWLVTLAVVGRGTGNAPSEDTGVQVSLFKSRSNFVLLSQEFRVRLNFVILEFFVIVWTRRPIWASLQQSRSSKQKMLAP